SILPLWIETLVAGIFITLTLEGNSKFKERLKDMGSKVFFFEARDIKKSFYILMDDGEIKVIPHYKGEPHVTMRGDTKTLLGLLLNKVDPDTVFFSRELEISGDTSAAIHFKNILNSLS
ncbi:MAG: SCP2 domain-containing protein, partial [Thermodesulfobacteriota bacterium]